MPAGMLIDTTKCILCLKCENECHSFYNLKDKRLTDDKGQTELGAYNYIALKSYEVQVQGTTKLIGVSKRCLHCFDPACASVCPVGALQKTAEGAVIWDSTKCFGCRYCQNACPFDIPKFEWDEPWPKISKCVFCHEERLLKNEIPVCAEVCPTQAIRFGERADMIALAHKRLAEEPEKYYNHIYGEHEAGGTAVMYLSAVEPEKLDFPKPEDELYPEFTKEFLDKIPIEMASLAILMGGAYLFRSRREATLKKEKDNSEKRG